MAPRISTHRLMGSASRYGPSPARGVLLGAGANPTDGVSTHIAGAAGNLPALELLLCFGVNVNGIPGGIPSPAIHPELGDLRVGRRRTLAPGTVPTPTSRGPSMETRHCTSPRSGHSPTLWLGGGPGAMGMTKLALNWRYGELPQILPADMGRRSSVGLPELPEKVEG